MPIRNVGTFLCKRIGGFGIFGKGIGLFLGICRFVSGGWCSIGTVGFVCGEVRAVRGWSVGMVLNCPTTAAVFIFIVIIMLSCSRISL